MKKWFWLLGVLVVSASVWADEDCDLSLNEAKQAYQKGNYTKAKGLFQYVQTECGVTYGDADNWIRKCDAALRNKGSKGPSGSSSTQTAATLSVNKSSLSVNASGTTESIIVTSNRNWDVEHDRGNMFSLTRAGNTLTVHINQNTSTSARSDYFIIKTVGGEQSVKISISQDGVMRPSTTLSVDNKIIKVGAAGGTEYIAVSSNQDWNIQGLIGSMFTVTPNGSTLKVVINPNYEHTDRFGGFSVTTADNEKSVFISITQSPARSSTLSSTQLPCTDFNRFKRFNYNNGKLEVDWISARALIGTSVGLEASVCGVRYKWIKGDLGVCGYRYDFINNSSFIYYQPMIKGYIPWDYNWAVTVGAGPVFRWWDFYDFGAWFVVEAGVHWHWGTNTSSEFFLRYDGSIAAGISISLSNGYDF